jgi:hypothetical protein
MEIKASTQSVDGPPDKPEVENPVKVTLDVPVYYMTERGPLLSKRAIFCGKAFADTVLTELNAILSEAQCGLLHLGFYNPRKARKKDGTPIVPTRWSNHAYGEAVDFKGVVRSSDPDDFLDIAGMKQDAPDLLAKIQARCAAAIEAAGRRAEIVDEGGWIHVGIWPRTRP